MNMNMDSYIVIQRNGTYDEHLLAEVKAKHEKTEAVIKTSHE
jgi:hypothetical protein